MTAASVRADNSEVSPRFRCVRTRYGDDGLWVQRKHLYVVFVGGPGTGKTNLATALGVAGITGHGRRARFYSTVDPVNALEQEKAHGKAGRVAAGLLRIDLVIPR